MGAVREVSQMIMKSLSTMGADAAQFRENVTAACSTNDQGLTELAEAYEVSKISRPHC